MTPTFHGEVDTRALTLRLAMALKDGYTAQPELLGDIRVKAASGQEPYQKDSTSVYLFFDLPAGANTVKVWSGEPRQYYGPLNLAVNIPPEGQPWSPGQQFATGVLNPTVSYPFPENATLVRGHVLLAGNPVSGALLHAAGAAPDYTTGDDGEYVLFFVRVKGASEKITVRATAPGGAVKDVPVLVQREATVAQDINL
jgi:hypothetical protein